MKKVSIVIPNYNGTGYIRNCLMSIRSSETKCDIIVVDNGSEDGSTDIIEKEFPEVKLIKLDKNTGFSHAVNVGIKESETEYVFLLNNDTMIKPDTIGKLTSAMDKSPGAFACQAMMVNMYDERLVDSAGDYYCALGWAFALGKDNEVSKYREFSSKRRVFSACAGAAMYRRELFSKVGYFDEAHFAYLEDVDIGFRAKIYGYESYMVPDAIVLHAQSSSTGSRYNKFKVSLSSRNSIYLIYKNMPPLMVIINLPLLLIGYAIKILFFARKGLGKTYINGLWNGICMCFTNKARGNKIIYDGSRLKTYVNIEIMLILNVIRRLAM